MTSNLLNIKSKQIERQTREQPSCKNRTRRKSYCPVRERIVTEYLFHVDDIERDTKEGQARIQDCAQGHISELADQLEQEGQSTGGCVLWSPDRSRYVAIWGNNRHRGCAVLLARGSSIGELEPGHLWMSLYEDDLADIPMMQAKENNVHPIAQRATMEDNENSMSKMIDAGLLDTKNCRFANMSDVDQRKAVLKMASDCHMPTGGKFRTLWNKVRKSSPAIRRVMRTWDKHEMATYFGSNNDYGICPTKLAGVSEGGEVFELKDGRTLGLYFINAQGTFNHTVLSLAHLKRNINKTADEIVLVCSLNKKKSAQISAARNTVVKKLKEYNLYLQQIGPDERYVDRVMFVPQTAQEQESEMISGKFITDTIL
jgi:hypothetical protein